MDKKARPNSAHRAATIAPRPLLDFVPQTGRPNKDHKVKQLVRQHARNYVSRSKGVQRQPPLLQIQLAVPESFSDDRNATTIEHHDENDTDSVEQIEVDDSIVATKAALMNESRISTGLQAEATNMIEEAMSLRSTTLGLTHYRPSVGLEFENSAESHYFQVFRKETSIELTGVFATSFWQRFLLQEAHSQRFVQHAIIAISALRKSMTITTQLMRDASSLTRLLRNQAVDDR